MKRTREAIRKAAKRAALHVVPHEDNGHLPHLMRSAHLAGVALLALLIFLGVSLGIPLSQRAGLTAAVYSSVLVDLTNDAREKQDIPALSVDPKLEEAARLKARDMAEKGYFAHTSPEGLTPWHWFNVAGYRFTHAGENLAVDFEDTRDVHKALLASPTHRANILGVNFTEIGVATYSGTYQGRDTTFVVEAFGNPAAERIAAAPAPREEVPAISPEEPDLARAPGEEPSEEVLGESEVSPVAQLPASAPTPVRVIHEDPQLAIAESTAPGVVPAPEPASSEPSAPARASSWHERFLMNPAPAATSALSALAFLVLAGTVSTAAHGTARSKHPRQIARGSVLILLLVLLLAIGQAITFPSLEIL